MEMSKERYQDLMLRFAKELYEVGVTEDMKKIAQAQMNRTPNAVSCGAEDDVRKFFYRHDGYTIEAVQTVKLVIKKCK
tara:strand:- start:135 stop:368 length:234 start_codon:yes stop_codon:yes gene_type:complete